MRNSVILLIILTAGIFSCGKSNKSTPQTDGIEALAPKENVKNPEKPDHHSDKFIDTKYEYADSIGKSIIIQNSLPKGGLKYTDPNGKSYVYAIFWTRIINERDNPLQFTIDFSADSFQLSSSASNYFKILLSSDTMTIDKEPLFNYGLTDLASFLDASLDKPSSLKRTINPNAAATFYVLTLFDQGVKGVVRAGLSLEDQKLYYRVNKKEFYCGNMTLKKW